MRSLFPSFALSPAFRRSPVRFVLGVLLLLGAAMASSRAVAQYDTATVLGTVTDPGGAALPGVEVLLKNLDLGTTLTRRTNGSGYYEFSNIQIGSYIVTVRATGFAESITKPFDVTVAARQRMDMPLALGQNTETVTVSVENSGLQTESGDRVTTIESEEMIDLPLNGREYTDLALLTPGVQSGNLQDGSVQQRRGSIVVNGNRSSVNNFLLDGLDNNSYQIANQGFNNQAIAESTDAVQQYSVTTSNFPAQYGRAGGAVVNVKTKSGSQAPHGTVYEYIRNTAFDAYGPFPGEGTKPALVQNQFGATFGWRFPRVKDFFFFVDYEGYRQATRTISSATVPTAEQRAGTFINESGVAVPLLNPFTGKKYPTGMIPTSDWTPFALAVIQDLPAPNAPGFSANYISTPRGHNYRDIGDIRLDKYLGNRLQTFVRASKQSIHITAPPSISGRAGGNGFGKVRVLTTSGVAGATWVVTPSSVLDVRLGITYQESGKVPYNQGIPNYYSQFSIPYPVSSQLPPAGLNTQAVRDFSTFGVEATQNQFSNPNTYNAKANYTLARGKHSFDFGYEWLHLDQTITPAFPLLGEDTYNGTFSYYAAANRPATSVARRQAYGLADFIFGARDTYQLAAYTTPTEFYDFHYAYAQDSWKPFPRLTLNYGLRYEFATPERSHDQPIVNFDPRSNALQIATSGSIYNEALVNPKLDDFAPRFGFAYSLFPNIVFRGGYGLSFIQWNRYGGESELLSNGPYTISGNVSQTLAQPLCADGSLSLTCFRTTMQGYPTSLTSPENFNTAFADTRYVPRDSAPGYVQSYSLGTQVQLAKNTIANIGYVGSHAVHVRVLADYNEAPLTAGGSLTLAQRRPIQNFNDIYDSLSAGFLRYNSLQTQVTHRTKGGLFLMNSFTWSKAIDNASADLEYGHGDSAYVPLHNVNYGAGISGYNQPINESFSAVWRTNFGNRLHRRALRQAINGWTLTSITRITSGIPINITYDPDIYNVVSGLGLSERPNLVAAANTVVNPRSQWTRNCNGYCNVLNAAAFTLPQTAQNGGSNPYGNTPRNAFTGPRYVNIDLGLQKNFVLPERFRLQFRAEAFNLANHTNFKTPVSDISSSSFGQYNPSASSVFPSRQLQLALRLSY